MSNGKTTRDFLKLTVAGTVGLGAPSTLNSADVKGSGKLALDKGVVYSMLPHRMTMQDRFKLARDTGFNVVQVPTPSDRREIEELKNAADSAGIRIDSTMNPRLWKFPLSSADPSVMAVGVDSVRNSLRTAKLWGANAALVVPAMVNPRTSYHEAWERSQMEIRKMLPLAEEVKVVIAIEEVWNKFLLSPLE